MAKLHPEILAEFEAASAARRVKGDRIEVACASPASDHFGDEKFWTEVIAVFRAYVEKQVNEVRADNALLQARIARLEVALTEKTTGQASWDPQIGRDLQ